MSKSDEKTPLKSLFSEEIFENRMKNLPRDPMTRDFPLNPTARAPRSVKAGTLYSLYQPQAYHGQTTLVSVNEDACNFVGLDWTEASQWETIITGKIIPRNSVMYCHRYGGHQFFNWAGQLGDGRSCSLGHANGFELSVKGIGQTMYARNGSGTCSLGEAVREFLLSESLHSMEIPTSRALAVYLKDDGNALLLRAAPCFYRIGHWELLYKDGDMTSLQKLTDSAMEYYFRDCLNDVAGWCVATNKYGRFLLQVAKRNASLVAHWMAYGFVHGTLNTDNISILGITLDLTGAACFLDVWDPDYSPNATDLERVYTFGKQKESVRFAVKSLVHCLQHLVKDRFNRNILDLVMQEYDKTFDENFLILMRRRLGITKQVATDYAEIIAPLIRLMETTKADVPIMFRSLSLFRVYIPQITGSTLPAIPDFEGMLVKWHCSRGDSSLSLEDLRLQWREWLDFYQQRLFLDTPWGSLIEYDRAKLRRMLSTNPKTISRGWILLDLDKQLNEWSETNQLQEEDTVEGFGDGILARLTQITHHLEKQPTLSKQPEFLTTAYKILLQDMFGNVSEEKGHGSLTSQERTLMNQWSGEPKEDQINPIFRLCT